MSHIQMPSVFMPHTQMPSVFMPHKHTPSQSIGRPSQSISWHALHTPNHECMSTDTTLRWHSRVHHDGAGHGHGPGQIGSTAGACLGRPAALRWRGWRRGFKEMRRCFICQPCEWLHQVLHMTLSQLRRMHIPWRRQCLQSSICRPC